jgi:short-subunit dehydrogenase
MSTEQKQPEVNLVLGATGGVGSSLRRMLAERGSRLFIAARESERLHDLARELEAPCTALDAQNLEQ